MNIRSGFVRNLCFITMSMGIHSINGCIDNKSESQPQESIPVITATIKLQSLPSSETGITFANEIKEEGMINIFTWHFLYNGAGVAAGDINNDGLPDLYFAGNMVPDKLYINKGNFQFEEIGRAHV